MSGETLDRAVGAQSATTFAREGILLVMVSAVAFGLMPIFTKLAYAAMGFPQDHRVKTVLAIRFTLAAGCLWAIWLFERRRSGARQAGTGAHSMARVLPLVALGALGYVGQSFAYFTALGSISASATGLLLYTYPILVTVLAWLVLGERMDSRKLVALGVATMGALMVLGIFTSLLGGAGLGTLNPEGVAWGLAAAGIYSVYIIAGARFTRGLPPLFVSAVIITSTALVYVVWSAIAGELHLDLRWEAWVWIIAIAGLCTVLAIVTFFAGLGKVGPSRAAIVSTLEPAVTVGLAALVLQESVSLEQLIGGALILSAVVLLQLETKDEGR